MRITTRVAAVLFAVCASVLVVATPAQANVGMASVDAAGTVHFAGTADGTALRVENLTATTVQLGVHHPMVLTAGPGCVAKPPTVMVNPVVCTFGGAVPTVHLAFGGGKDLCACYAPVSYTIDFGAGDDTLWYIDTTYPATVFGGDGADSLQSGPADDTLDGGAGFDTVVYGTRASGVVANLAVGGGGMFPSEYDVYQGIEALVGSDKDDVLVGNGSPNRLDGAGGDDSLYGEGGDDLLLGGAPYQGKPGDDTYYGGSGNDTVSYADHLTAPVSASLNGVRDDGAPSVNEKDLIGTDVENLVGGGAADTLVGDRGPNRLYGRDAAVFEDGGDFLSGLGGDDTLYGYRGADLLLGGDGDDRLIGGEDTDSMYGGEGRDYASYETHTARVTASLDGKANDGAAGENDYIDDDVENLNGGIASDTLYGNDGSNVIVGDSPVSIGGGNDEIYAGGGNDKVYAGAGNDIVTGGAGDDTVYGSWGDDQLWGEAGNDLLDGGPGKDTCDVGANGGTTTNCSP